MRIATLDRLETTEEAVARHERGRLFAELVETRRELHPDRPAHRDLLQELLSTFRGVELAMALDAEGYVRTLAEAGRAVHELGLGLE